MQQPPPVTRPADERTLAVFDLDGTITRRDTLGPYLAGFLWRHPQRLWRLLLCLAPLSRYLLEGRDRGALKAAVIHHTLGEVPRAELARWTAQFTARLLRTGLYGEALECIAAHRRNGAHLVLLSASTDLYVPAIARALGFDECLCTELGWRDDATLDGTLRSANRRDAEKARCVTTLLVEHQPLLSYAYGNSRADLPHLALVSAGTYVNGPARHLTELPNVRAVRWYRHGAAPLAGAAADL